MKRALFFLLMVTSFGAVAQENPKIESLLVTENADNPRQAKKDLNIAEKYYAMGPEARVNALVYYQKVYPYRPNSKSMNYKMGVCFLESPTPAKALTYFNASSPEVAGDYYYLLGKAYMYNKMYNEANAAFIKYSQVLPWTKRGAFKHQLEQLKRECAFGAKAGSDSLPYFVINMGPGINSSYADYAAIETLGNDTTIYFTTRRPVDKELKSKSNQQFPEKVMKVTICNGKPCNEVTRPKTLKSNQNMSVSGYSPKDDKLFVYIGKREFGNVYFSSLKKEKPTKPSALSGSANHVWGKETSFAQDSLGNAYIISDRFGGFGGKDIYQLKKRGANRFKKAQNIGKHINTRFDEEGLFVTPDGKTIFFASNGQAGYGGFDIYRIDKLETGKWSAPVNLGYPINSANDELFYQPTSDSLVALISTIRPDAIGGFDIYKVIKDNSIPFYLKGKAINGADGKPLKGDVSVYALGNDKKMASAATDSVSGEYAIAFKDIGNFIALINVAGFKTISVEIPRATKRNAVVLLDFELERLKYPIVLSGKVTNGKTGFPIAAKIAFKGAASDSVLHLAYANDTSGIYNITFEDKANLLMEISAEGYTPTSEVLQLKQYVGDSAVMDLKLYPVESGGSIQGKVVDNNTQQPITAKVSLLSTDMDRTLATAICDSVGNYLLAIDTLGAFVVDVSAEGYFYVNEPIVLTADSVLLTKDFELKKMSQGVKIVIENILFTTGKSALLPQSFKELDKLAQLLRDNPEVRIEVSGHTDNVGNKESNKKLSKARALSVKNYLVSKGVPEGNVEYTGYGSEQAVALNNTAEGKAKNRRVEIKVIGN